MNDPNLKVSMREQRTLDVNDITGKKAALAQDAPRERLAPIRPRVMEYDIINPTDGQRLRMSQYGKNVLSDTQKNRMNRIRLRRLSPAPKLRLARLCNE